MILKCGWYFLSGFNGATFIPEQMWHEDSDLQLYTDASGGIDFGGCFQGRWFQDRWPESCTEAKKNSIAWIKFFFQ